MKTRPMKMAILLLKVCLIAASALTLFLVVERIRGKVMLANFFKGLTAKGDNPSFTDFKPRKDPAPNGALLISIAGRQIHERASYLLPHGRQLTASGSAIAGFRQNEWIEEGKTLTWVQVAQALETNTDALRLARDALTNLVFDNKVEYELGFKMRFDHLAPIKILAQEFGAAIQLALHQGRLTNAIDDLIAQADLLRTLDHDHLLISELVRTAIGGIASANLWEALQADGWTEADLARLVEPWSAPSFVGPTARALVGEQLFARSSYALMRKSNKEAIGFLDAMGDAGWFFTSDEAEDGPWWRNSKLSGPILRTLRNEVYCRIWRFAWLDQTETSYLRYLQGLIQATRRLETHKSFFQWQREVDELYDISVPRGWYGRARMKDQTSYGVDVRGAARPLRLEAERQLLLTALALKRYHLRHHSYPNILADLVPEFLLGVPTDYMDGQPLRYRRDSDDGFLLYSIGENGIDDGGNGTKIEGRPNYGLGNRLDMIWPREATPEEARAHVRKHPRN